MVESIIALLLLGLYLHLNRGYPFEPQVIAAALIMFAYLAVYFLVPPSLSFTNQHIGKAFGFLPLVAFGVILFPQWNLRLPIEVTRLFGWLGLVALFVALGIFKLFIW